MNYRINSRFVVLALLTLVTALGCSRKPGQLSSAINDSAAPPGLASPISPIVPSPTGPEEQNGAADCGVITASIQPLVPMANNAVEVNDDVIWKVSASATKCSIFRALLGNVVKEFSNETTFVRQYAQTGLISGEIVTIDALDAAGKKGGSVSRASNAFNVIAENIPPVPPIDPPPVVGPVLHCTATASSSTVSVLVDDNLNFLAAAPKVMFSINTHGLLTQVASLDVTKGDVLAIPSTASSTLHQIQGTILKLGSNTVRFNVEDVANGDTAFCEATVRLDPYFAGSLLPEVGVGFEDSSIGHDYNDAYVCIKGDLRLQNKKIYAHKSGQIDFTISRNALCGNEIKIYIYDTNNLVRYVDQYATNLFGPFTVRPWLNAGERAEIHFKSGFPCATSWIDQYDARAKVSAGCN